MATVDAHSPFAEPVLLPPPSASERAAWAAQNQRLRALVADDESTHGPVSEDAIARLHERGAGWPS